ncbi:MAG: hypothetical protein ACD_46C00077G0001, partial [uncultured bacterium]
MIELLKSFIRDSKSLSKNKFL